MQSLKKICQEKLKIESRNKVAMEGQTGHSTQVFDWRVEHNTQHFFKWRGLKRDYENKEVQAVLNTTLRQNIQWLRTEMHCLCN